MRRNRLELAIIAGLAFAPCIANAAQPIELKSTTVQFPDSTRLFPDAPGSDTINANCLICHSASMALTQPSLTREVWTAEVNKMINIYKAPVAAEDVGAIVDYLVALKGAK